LTNQSLPLPVTVVMTFETRSGIPLAAVMTFLVAAVAAIIFLVVLVAVVVVTAAVR
jgi:hypothetical protein